MPETDVHLRLLRFGNFEVDLRSGELRKAGAKLKLSGQPFQVLSILLERPGEVVTREELQSQLWPDTFVDVDHNLNTAINKIREVLGDSAENPRFVETLPRRGYRFIAPVEGNGVVTPLAPPPTGHESGFRYWASRSAILVGGSNGSASRVPVSRPLWLAAAALIVVIAALLVWRSLPGQPTIEGALQLTDDGNPKLLTSALLSDGYRIYFNELRAGSPVIAQVAVSGGETGQIVSRIPSPTLAALAMDSSSLLALGVSNFFGSLWLLPLPAGEPRQLRNVVAQNASFTPDGHLIFSKDTSLYIAEKDGSNPRKLRDLPSHVNSPVVSPDGKRIRLTVEGDVYEVSLGGELGRKQRTSLTAGLAGRRRGLLRTVDFGWKILCLSKPKPGSH